MSPTPATSPWPDSIDALALLSFLGLVLGCVGLGYVLMVLDVRSYLRSLRRHVVRVTQWTSATPSWARWHTPRCLVVFGLQLPCTESELLGAYRTRVKALHPDRGGDQRRFLQLQAYFEESLRLVREQRPPTE